MLLLLKKKEREEEKGGVSNLLRYSLNATKRVLTVNAKKI